MKQGTNGRPAEGTSMLSQQLFKAAFGESPHQGMYSYILPKLKYNFTD